MVIKGSTIEMEKVPTIFTVIDLSKNNFEGQIPQIIGKLNSIRGLNLSHNSLTGHIPTSLVNLTMLEWLDLSSNKLIGEIPPLLQFLVNLTVLNLSSNLLSAQIPLQIAFCAYLNVIDLSNNLLTGSISEQLGLLVLLSIFDVLNSRLASPSPMALGNRTGNLVRFNTSSYVGNKDLYGYPLPPLKGKGLSIMAIVGIGLGSRLLSLVLSFSTVCIWLRVSEQNITVEEGKISQFMPDY
ncbi:receptor-like protein 44 [Camellia sinensis]|uniref:receptor-like protein 44 n=1 Tax=Camellia sinensis TaxID=4442 RepID=UPI00103650D4|nr:receptor-like protein 44 [Camellia sinensis]